MTMNAGSPRFPQISPSFVSHLDAGCLTRPIKKSADSYREKPGGNGDPGRQHTAHQSYPSVSTRVARLSKGRAPHLNELRRSGLLAQEFPRTSKLVPGSGVLRICGPPGLEIQAALGVCFGQLNLPGGGLHQTMYFRLARQISHGTGSNSSIAAP
jgi:hypothetical protein